jgi:hypothetical protein
MALSQARTNEWKTWVTGRFNMELSLGPYHCRNCRKCGKVGAVLAKRTTLCTSCTFRIPHREELRIDLPSMKRAAAGWNSEMPTN